MHTRTNRRDVAATLIYLVLAVQASLCIGCARAHQVAGDSAANPADTSKAGVPAPESVIGHKIGEQYTRHSDVVRYFEALDAASDRVRLDQYGWTWERRPLYVATISSPENLANLDKILERNRALTRVGSGAPSDAEVRDIIANNPGVIWLSYNVHGNEASATECAIQVAYTLAGGDGERIASALKNLVIVIDPCLNPDGRDRYVNWVRTQFGVAANADPAAAEHSEPWPGGRTNHYLFDLNRDWLWLVHPESRSRLEVYRRYMPQFHADYHEQGHTSPYFFGAGDTPYNANIPEESKRWFDKYGRENARVFDENGLEYVTRERFDYLYPGYGKVLPCYQGAIGLLCEKAGHSRSGTAIEITEQYTLTLADRVRDHFLTSMSYVESSADWRRDNLERFRRYFVESAGLDASPMAVAISPDNDPALLAKVWDLCSRQGIEINTLDRALTTGGMIDYRSGESAGDVEIAAGSWVIRADQPMGRLVRAIFERSTAVEDPRTYDISGWSVPLCFGLESWYSDKKIDAPMTRLASYRAPAAVATGAPVAEAVALIIDSGQHRFPAGAGVLSEHKVTARALGKPVVIEGRAFAHGSLVVHKFMNAERDLARVASDLLKAGVSVYMSRTSLADEGYSLGANTHPRATLPRVALAFGEGTQPNSAGHFWHLLDVEMPVPYSIVNLSELGSLDLSKYTVVAMPDGASLSGGALDRLKQWVQGGGTLVAVGSSASWASRAVLEVEDVTPKPEEEAKDKDRSSLITYKMREELDHGNLVSGGMVRASVDTTHPLAAGSREWIGLIKDNGRGLPVSRTGSVIARYDGGVTIDETIDEVLYEYIEKTAPVNAIGGQVGERATRDLGGRPAITAHRYGRGSVICFADDVTIRGFHHAGMRLLMNAITLGPTFGG